jgi:cytochrome P450
MRPGVCCGRRNWWSIVPIVAIAWGGLTTHASLAQTVSPGPAEHEDSGDHLSHRRDGQSDGAFHRRFEDPEKWAKEFDNPERDAWQKPEEILDALHLTRTSIVADIDEGTVLAGRTPRYEDLARLRHTRMVIEESMRLFPPAHTIGRQPVGDDEVLGHRIPAGSTVLILPWLLHRKPALWENPDRFDPERFAPERAARRPRFAYIPFGAGPRICIGAAFAMAEAMVILATIGQRYRLRLKPGFPVEPQGLITLRPRYGLQMTLERRTDVKAQALKRS